ncbi:MAG: ABC transporter substrate-binding protein [Gemmatimonadales bacterium]
MPRVAVDPRFRVYVQAYPGARAIQWKVSHPLFRDRRVRKALTLALDRHELLRLINVPPDLPITDGVFTERQFRRREWPEPLPYDPGEASALLAAAGWLDHDSDGIRENNGRRFHFTATVFNGSTPFSTAVA